MWEIILLFIAGFYFLVKGADLLVDGASSIAKKAGISTLVIGLTIVAFGTSAPELIVNILASYTGSNELAVGNILGSNISNIFLILGAAAMVTPLKVGKGTVWKEIPFSLLAILALAALTNDSLLDGFGPAMLSRSDGIVLLLFFSIFIYYTFGISKKNTHLFGAKGEPVMQYSRLKSFFMIIGGMLGLGLGGHWIVTGAVEIAAQLGLSQAFIGLTLVAIGTSLPELATSLIAAKKGNADIAIGNVVGSNIFNVFWILGLSSIISPIVFNPVLNFDIGVVILATFLLFSFLFIGKKQLIERWQGAMFISIYVAYLVFVTYRG